MSDATRSREQLLTQLAAEQAAIASATDTLNFHRANAAELTEQLLTVTNELPEEERPLTYAGLTVRLNKGRTVTSWDAALLEDVLPVELQEMCLDYFPKADSKVLNTLAETGKLPAEALAARTIKPAEARWIVEAAR